MTGKRPQYPHPLQPIVRAPDGVIRFQANAIVSFIVQSMINVSRYPLCGIMTTEGKLITFNDLMAMPWSDEDRDHFNQLHGYSVSGLPWRSEARQAEADRIAEDVVAAARLLLSNKRGI